MEVTIIKAGLEDCEQIHEMQVASFIELLEKYKDYNTNPAAESVERIKERLEQDFTDYYLIRFGAKIIGAIRIVKLNKKSCRISPMFILPEYQGNGYAQQVIKAVELLYEKAEHWELDTIMQEPKLCYLYEKMGYAITGKEEIIHDNMTIISYAKYKHDATGNL